METNPYMKEINANLPRILSLIDNDKSASSYGLGDRYHWAWGLIDFGNGTFQGMAHGFARLWKNKLWPYDTAQDIFFERINSLFIGAKYLTKSSGSLEEAFPNEGSYCVTALVAFDLLSTIELLEENIDENTKNNWIKIVKPMIGYLLNSDENHAIISNHLATAVAALVLWVNITNEIEAEKKAKILLQRIISNQSSEGWFREYDGADPGYETLCLYYMAIIQEKRPDWELDKYLSKSINFLWNFAHPDGSFGGLYGSRSTRFYIPAGIEALSRSNIKARALSDFMSKSIYNNNVVTLSSIDEPNLIPVFNAYCMAASLFKENDFKKEIPSLPCISKEQSFQTFNDAGLVIDKGKNHYTIINTSKGGVIYHYVDGINSILNGGVVITKNNEKYGSALQGSYVSFSNNNKTIEINSKIGRMSKSLPLPWQFLLIRIMSISFFKSYFFREFFKKLLVKFLIKEKKPWPVQNTRIINLGKSLVFKDKLSLKKPYKIVKNLNYFVPFHMASKGYWQNQDEKNIK